MGGGLEGGGGGGGADKDAPVAQVDRAGGHAAGGAVVDQEGPGAGDGFGFEVGEVAGRLPVSGVGSDPVGNGAGRVVVEPGSGKCGPAQLVDLEEGHDLTRRRVEINTDVLERALVFGAELVDRHQHPVHPAGVGGGDAGELDILLVDVGGKSGVEDAPLQGGRGRRRRGGAGRDRGLVADRRGGRGGAGHGGAGRGGRRGRSGRHQVGVLYLPVRDPAPVLVVVVVENQGPGPGQPFPVESGQILHRPVIAGVGFDSSGNRLRSFVVEEGLVKRSPGQVPHPVHGGMLALRRK